MKLYQYEMNMEELIEKIKTLMLIQEMVNIVISGPSCSGKTTLSNKLKNYFSKECEVTIISQDDYFKNLEDMPRCNKGFLADSINAFCIFEFIADIKIFFKNKTVKIPEYDISNNVRISKNKIVTLGKINIFEGLHVIELLMHKIDCITIYVDTDIETCLKRRIIRDTSKYGINELRIRQNWKDCIIPMYNAYILPQKTNANILINCEGRGDFGN